MTLSKRLGLIASLIPYGAKVCDVGTDHGLLPIYLKETGKALSVIATDIRVLPLENARNNIIKTGVSDIDTRLCDGLEAVKESETDTIVIAGMGGEVISHIIDSCYWLKKNNSSLLILQPTTSPEVLRKFLLNSGFEILNEHAVSENDKIYSVMTVRFTGRKYTVPEYFYYCGKLDITTVDGLLYIKKQYNRIIKCAESIKNVIYMQEKYNQYNAIAENILKILKTENKNEF